MDDAARSICIHCGKSATETARFNHLDDGRPCPTCMERLFYALPPALPGFAAHEPVESFSRDRDLEPEPDRPA
jgi:hypothetical protein